MLHERRPKPQALDVEDEPSDTKKTWTKVMSLATGGGFKYNPRMLLVYLPCLIILLGYGGNLTVVTVALGIMAGFVTDLFGFTQATFLVAWLTVGAVEVGLLVKGAMLIKNSLVNVFLLGNFAVISLLLGCWISLQFKWLKKTSANSMVLIERILFGISPLMVSSTITYTAIAYNGIANAGLIFLVTFASAYYLLILPLPSSYKQAPANTPAVYICGQAEALVNTIAMLSIPSFIHIASYARTVIHVEHLTTVLLLVSGAVFVLRLFNKKNALWFLQLPPHQMRKVELIMSISSVLVLIYCFEYRVIFQTFYYSIPLPVPLNYLFVTLALYFGGVTALLVLMGNAPMIGKPLLMVFSSLSAYMGAYAVGINPVVGLLAVLAAITLVEFFFERNIRDYIIFVLASTLTLAWFMRKSFLFLDFHFDVLGLSIQQLAILLLVMFMLAAFIPGMIYSKNTSVAALSGFVVAGFAATFAFIEVMLFLQGSAAMYPWYLVGVTSLVGYQLVNHLQNEKAITPAQTWLALSVFVGKAAVIVAPSFGAFVAGVLLTLSFSAQFLFYPAGRMSKQQGAALAVALLISSLVARSALAEDFLELVFDHGDSEMLKIGFTLLLWGTSLLPLVFRSFPHINAFRIVSFASIFFSMLFVVAEPEFGVVSSLASSYLWTAVVVISLSLVCPISDSTPLKIGYSIICGTLIGFSVTGSLQAATWLSYSFLPTCLSLGIMFIVFALKPTPATVGFAPWLLLLVELAFVVSWLLNPVFNLLAIANVGRGQIRSKMVIAAMSHSLIVFGFFFNLLSAMVLKAKITNANGRRTDKLLEWAPLIGNLATILAFALAVLIQSTFTKNSMSILFVAPLLLLLNQDPYLLSGLTEERRYPTVVAFGSVGLLVVGLQSLHILFLGALVQFDWIRVALIAIDVGLFLGPVASHGMFAFFLWSFEKQNQTMWLIIAPLNLLAIFSSAKTSWSFAITGLLMCVVQFFMSKNIQSFGKKNLI